MLLAHHSHGPLSLVPYRIAIIGGGIGWLADPLVANAWIYSYDPDTA